jgi:hypothetical protein
MDRRDFLKLSTTAAIGAPALLSACAPVPSGAPAPTASAGSGPYPTFVPFKGPAKADYHLDDPNYSDGYENYPQNPFKAVQEPPGAGGRVDLTQSLYLPPATPYESNPTWQYINKQLNADVRMNLMPSLDYLTHFATLVAGDDLPDIIHIYQGYKLAPNLPAFFKAKCADLTPYLAGDAAEYKATVGCLRDLMTTGVFPPDSATIAQSRPLHAAGKFVVAVDGYGNAWADLWRRGLDYNNHMSRMLKPFPASAGGPLQAMMGGGYISMNALKKAPPERIKELLRIMNYLAAPFASQEDLLLSYGIKDQDYTIDDRGNPFPTTDGLARSQFVPWQYIARRPHVDYQADLPGFVKTSFEAQRFLMPAAVYDPAAKRSGCSRKRLALRHRRSSPQGIPGGHGHRAHNALLRQFGLPID